MPVTRTQSTVYLGLGSNLGDRHGFLCRAVDRLAEHDGIAVDDRGGLASLYETSPVGGPPGQQSYLNSAIRVTTTLAPLKLLSVIHSVEASLGRERTGRWSARTIDVDILLYDDLVLESASLTVPHPRLHERRFVLAPLVEIAASAIHPVLGVSVAHLAQSLPSCPSGGDVAVVQGSDWYRVWLSEHAPDADAVSGA